jgi:serine/threonine-protein kinase RsbW
VGGDQNDVGLLPHATADSTDIVLDRPAQSRDLVIVLDAVPAALSAARAKVRTLNEWGWPLADAADIELAVNEAIANVIEHAYPPEETGPVSVHAWVSVNPRDGKRRVVVAVTDRGRRGTHHPEVHPASARGHGLVVMSGCMAELHIERGAAGTTIVMISYPVPPAPHP